MQSVSAQPPACWIYGSLLPCGVLRGLCGSGVMAAQRLVLCTWPNLSVTSRGGLLGIKKIKYPGQYADYIFMLPIQIQNFPHGACWKIFRVKRQRRMDTGRYMGNMKNTKLLHAVHEEKKRKSCCIIRLGEI